MNASSLKCAERLAPRSSSPKISSAVSSATFWVLRYCLTCSRRSRFDCAPLAASAFCAPCAAGDEDDLISCALLAALISCAPCGAEAVSSAARAAPCSPPAASLAFVFASSPAFASWALCAASLALSSCEAEPAPSFCAPPSPSRASSSAAASSAAFAAPSAPSAALCPASAAFDVPRSSSARFETLFTLPRERALKSAFAPPITSPLKRSSPSRCPVEILSSPAFLSSFIPTPRAKPVPALFAIFASLAPLVKIPAGATFRGSISASPSIPHSLLFSAMILSSSFTLSSKNLRFSPKNCFAPSAPALSDTHSPAVFTARPN